MSPDAEFHTVRSRTHSAYLVGIRMGLCFYPVPLWLALFVSDTNQARAVIPLYRHASDRLDPAKVNFQVTCVCARVAAAWWTIQARVVGRGAHGIGSYARVVQSPTLYAQRGTATCKKNKRAISVLPDRYGSQSFRPTERHAFSCTIFDVKQTYQFRIHFLDIWYSFQAG